jgi:hypothetical protein
MTISANIKTRRRFMQKKHTLPLKALFQKGIMLFSTDVG